MWTFSRPSGLGGYGIEDHLLLSLKSRVRGFFLFSRRNFSPLALAIPRKRKSRSQFFSPLFGVVFFLPAVKALVKTSYPRRSSLYRVTGRRLGHCPNHVAPSVRLCLLLRNKVFRTAWSELFLDPGMARETTPNAKATAVPAAMRDPPFCAAFILLEDQGSSLRSSRMASDHLFFKVPYGKDSLAGIFFFPSMAPLPDQVFFSTLPFFSAFFHTGTSPVRISQRILVASWPFSLVCFSLS